MSVKADNLSESVPEASTLAINCSSDLDVEGGGGRAAWRFEALARRRTSSACVGDSREGIGRSAFAVSSEAYHREVAGMFYVDEMMVNE